MKATFKYFASIVVSQALRLVSTCFANHTISSWLKFIIEFISCVDIYSANDSPNGIICVRYTKIYTKQFTVLFRNESNAPETMDGLQSYRSEASFGIGRCALYSRMWLRPLHIQFANKHLTTAIVWWVWLLQLKMIELGLLWAFRSHFPLA